MHFIMHLMYGPLWTVDTMYSHVDAIVRIAWYTLCWIISYAGHSMYTLWDQLELCMLLWSGCKSYCGQSFDAEGTMYFHVDSTYGYALSSSLICAYTLFIGMLMAYI